MEQGEISKGLGDTVAKFTNLTGMDRVAKQLAAMLGKEDCGCDERRELLNRLVPYSTSKIPTGNTINKNGESIQIFN
jgi:hypothetical protein